MHGSTSRGCCQLSCGPHRLARGGVACGAPGPPGTTRGQLSNPAVLCAGLLSPFGPGALRGLTVTPKSFLPLVPGDEERPGAQERRPSLHFRSIQRAQGAARAQNLARIISGFCSVLTPWLPENFRCFQGLIYGFT